MFVISDQGRFNVLVHRSRMVTCFWVQNNIVGLQCSLKSFFRFCLKVRTLGYEYIYLLISF